MEKYVFFEERTEFLDIIKTVFGLKGFYRWSSLFWDRFVSVGLHILQMLVALLLDNMANGECRTAHAQSVYGM